MKGFDAPVRVWRVLAPSSVEGRFGARQAAGLTPFVGRERELALLIERWTDAKAGRGQVVLIPGEPGIGKSRVVRALQGRLTEEDHASLRYYCSSLQQTSALWPIIDQLERAAGFEADEAAEQRLGKLEALLARSSKGGAELLPLVTDLLSLPAANCSPQPPLSPQRRKEVLFDGLLDWIADLASRRPVLAVFEDVHWIDPSSAEFLDRVVQRAESLPALVLVTFRPEFKPSWVSRPYVMGSSCM